MPNRSRFASRLALWAFAAALVLKSAVPMLAALSAGLQGKAVAEICDVYGVAVLAPAGVKTAADVSHHGDHAPAHEAEVELANSHVHAHAGAGDAHVHAHVAAVQARSDEPTPPAHGHASKAGDHCLLTGMVAIATSAAPAGDLPAPAVGAPASITAAGAAVLLDAAARWAARLEHGPPALA